MSWVRFLVEVHNLNFIDDANLVLRAEQQKMDAYNKEFLILQGII